MEARDVVAHLVSVALVNILMMPLRPHPSRLKVPAGESPSATS